MLDRTIPFYNVILRCDRYQTTEFSLPDGFSFRPYRAGDEKAWAALEYEIGDFESPEAAERYFVTTYCADRRQTERRCIFLTRGGEEIIGSCIAWRDRREAEIVASLHWLAVSPAFQRQKLGEALCRETMGLFQSLCEMPVYIHTQPWSYRAILLYVKLGFQLLTTDSFAGYENQYASAMRVLKGILSEEQYRELVLHSR